MIQSLDPFPISVSTTGSKSSKLSKGVRAGQVYVMLLVTVSQLFSAFSWISGAICRFLSRNAQCLFCPPLEPMETFCIHTGLYQGISEVSCSLGSLFFFFFLFEPGSCYYLLFMTLILVLEHRESRQYFVHSLSPVKKFGYS